MAAVTVAKLTTIAQAYAERIAKMLGVDVYTLPPITIVPAGQLGVDAEGNPILANTLQTGMQVDAGYLKGATLEDIRGMLIHESVHFAQNVDAATADKPGMTRAQIEPIANAIRYQIMGNSKDWQLDPTAERWVNMAPWQVRAASDAMAAGTFTNQFFNQLEDGRLSRAEAATYGVAPVLGADGQPVDTTTNTASGAASDYPGYTQQQKEGSGNAGDYTPGGAGGGKGGEKDTAAERRADATTRAGFLSTLSGYGIVPGANINKLIEEAVFKNWDSTQFLMALRETAAYADAFPGIFNEDGTIKMSEETYLSEKIQYQAYASTYGINMGEGRMAWLFKNDVTSSEFNDRADAFTRLNRDKQLYAAFGRELVQAGIAKPQDVNNPKEMFRFVMGEGNKEWYDLWQDAVTRNAAIQAGISFKKHASKYTTLSQGVIEHISSLGLSEAEMASKFGAVEEALRKVLPLQEADTYGVSKKGIVAASFGGKGASAARGKLERATETAAAFDEARATSAVYSDDQGHTVTQGVTDTRRRQQSEG